MKWITREHVHVDRVACPWLIRKFVDPKAEFIFAPPEDISRLVDETGAIPFDIEGVELGHHADKCTFDAIVEKYNLLDEPLLELAEIVRAADTKAFELAPESIGLAAIADGASMMLDDDREAVDKGAYLYEALYTSCRIRNLRDEYESEMANMDRRSRRDFLREKLRKN